MVEIPLPPPPLAQKEGHDLEGNLFFSLGKYQSSGRERRMVKYRVKKDWASYELTPQWQSWLRHSRAEPPSVQELIADAQRRENTRRLAQIADARWATERGERPAVTSGEDALNAIKQNKSHAAGTLPAQDPGATFQPQGWSAKIGRRE